MEEIIEEWIHKKTAKDQNTKESKLDIGIDVEIIRKRRRAKNKKVNNLGKKLNEEFQRDVKEQCYGIWSDTEDEDKERKSFPKELNSKGGSKLKMEC